MEDALITLLSTFGYKVIRQGSLADGVPYPDTFFTFWNRSEEDVSFYSNESVAVAHTFDVNVYSTDPTTVYTLLDQARSLLKANGWIIATRGYDVRSDEITHIGRGFEVTYRQSISIQGGI